MPVKVTQDVLEVLARSTVAPTFVQLPDEQLDRKLYVKVAKALEACGFVWDRKAKKHVGNGEETVEQLLLTGEYTDAKKEFDAFYTPQPIADKVRAAAGIEPGMRILEPSAGEGALLRGLDCAALYIVAVEKNNAVARALYDNRNFALDHVWNGDFLSAEPGVKPWLAADFDRVIMNPPFSKGQDAKHILHALKFLKPGGRLVAIGSAGFKFRKDGAYGEFWRMADQLLKRGLSHPGIEDLPPGSFKASGTNVNTVLVTIDV